MPEQVIDMEKGIKALLEPKITAPKKFWLITWKQWHPSGKILNCSQIVKGETGEFLLNEMFKFNTEAKLNTHTYEVYDLTEQFIKFRLELHDLNIIDEPTE